MDKEKRMSAKALKEGFKAFEAGKTLEDNPYTAGYFFRTKAKWWAVGWKSAKESREE